MSNNEIFNMYFGIIDDPRCEANVIHPLVDILKISNGGSYMRNGRIR